MGKYVVNRDQGVTLNGVRYGHGTEIDLTKLVPEPPGNASDEVREAAKGERAKMEKDAARYVKDGSLVGGATSSPTPSKTADTKGEEG